MSKNDRVKKLPASAAHFSSTTVVFALVSNVLRHLFSSDSGAWITCFIEVNAPRVRELDAVVGVLPSSQ